MTLKSESGKLRGRWVLVLCAILLQVGALAYMAANREHILATGQTVYLRTAPIDPMDPFRGEFVRLDYDISRIDASQLPDTISIENITASKNYKKQTPVYVALKPSANNLYDFDYLALTKPADALFLRGYLKQNYRFGGGGMELKYGIEKLFVEQGQGLLIEETRGNRRSLQVPMEVEVAIGKNGTGVIRDYRWSELGIKLEVVCCTRQQREANRDAGDENESRLSPVLRLTLKNVSERRLLLADPGKHCAFALIPWQGVRENYAVPNHDCGQTVITKDDLIWLQPEQSHVVDLDMSEPRWFVRAGVKLGEMGKLAANESFRLQYQSPSVDTIAAIADVNSLWQGNISSPAFRASGRID